MKVLVCGGRDFQDWGLLRDILDNLHTKHPFTELIHGDAPGADTLADSWARRQGFAIKVKPFPARWSTEGLSAGPRRNQRMIDEGKPDLVVAFQGKTGTQDMISRAKAVGIRVIEV